MATTNWIYSDNFIANAVGDNYILSLVVAKFHLDALTANNSDADIAARELVFLALYNTLNSKAVAKAEATGDRITDTRTLKEVFADINKVQLPLWKNKIAAVYPVGSAKYKGFFPKAEPHISTGRIDSRILALQTLAQATVDDGGLAAVAALIGPVSVNATAKRNVQLSQKSTVKGIPGVQKAAIAAMCDAHYYDHGLVITKFSNNPGKIASFTDVQSLQRHVHSNTYNITVNAGKTKTALTHKFKLADAITITSTTNIVVWVIDSSKNIIKPTGVNVPAGVPKIVGFPDLGNFANRVMQVKNLDPLVKATVTIELP